MTGLWDVREVEQNGSDPGPFNCGSIKRGYCLY